MKREGEYTGRDAKLDARKIKWNIYYLLYSLRNQFTSKNEIDW